MRKKWCNLGDKKLMNSSRCKASQKKENFNQKGRTITSHLPFVIWWYHVSMTKSPCIWSLPCLMSRTHFKQSMGESVNSSNFYKCSEPIKPKFELKTKMGLAEGGDITIKGVITRILLFIANRGIWSINFTRRSPVRRTYKTEPSSKKLPWGRSTPMYPGKYSFPFVLVLVSFNS